MRAFMSALLLSLPSQALALDLDAVTQDVVVDLTGDALHVEIDLLVVSSGLYDGLPMLTPALPIGAALVDGSAVEIMPHPSYPDLVTVVPLPGADVAGAELEVHLELDGTPDCTDGLTRVCTFDDDTALLLPSAPGFAWHYASLLGVDGFVGTIEVRAPSGRTVLAGQGSATSVVDNGDGSSSWRFSYGLPTEALWLYARALDAVRDEGGGVAGYFPGASGERDVMQRVVDTAAALRPIYEARLGALDADELHFMLVPSGYPFGGMGMLANVLLGDFIAWPEFDYLVEQGTAHELAHTWWGGLTSALEYEEGPVLQEGLAEYSAWLALGEAHGDDVRTAGSRMNAVWYMYGRPGPVDVAPLDPDAGSTQVSIHVWYHKASTVFRSLEEAAGKEAFTAALTDVVALGPGGATMAGLVEAVLAESGVDVSPIVEQWLERAGFPRLDVSARFERGAACLDVEVTGAFAFELPVVVRGADGTVEEHRELVAADARNELCFSSSARPLSVAVDPRWTLVREVRPAEPADVNLDGRVDAADLVEAALHQGALPTARRVDGGYDPLFDVDLDLDVDGDDLAAIVDAARR